MALSPAVTIFLVLAGGVTAAAGQRQKVTFDYGWRFKLGDPTTAVPGKSTSTRLGRRRWVAVAAVALRLRPSPTYTGGFARTAALSTASNDTSFTTDVAGEVRPHPRGRGATPR